MEHKIVRYFDTEMQADGSEDMYVEGYALKFDKETVIGRGKWGWREQIARTALDGAKLDNVVLNFNHSLDSVLARTINGSLRLAADAIGLKIMARIIDTGIGRDVYKLIREGLITRMSFAATVKKSVWTFTEDDSDEMDARLITEFDTFYDVSAVTFPAYEDTDITARSAEYAFRQKQIYERQLQIINKITGGKAQ